MACFSLNLLACFFVFHLSLMVVVLFLNFSIPYCLLFRCLWGSLLLSVSPLPPWLLSLHLTLVFFSRIYAVPWFIVQWCYCVLISSFFEGSISVLDFSDTCHYQFQRTHVHQIGSMYRDGARCFSTAVSERDMKPAVCLGKKENFSAKQRCNLSLRVWTGIGQVKEGQIGPGVCAKSQQQ